MNDAELQELDEGYRHDFALATSRARRPAGAESEHPVLHLLQHPEVRPKPEDERSAETTSRA